MCARGIQPHHRGYMVESSGTLTQWVHGFETFGPLVQRRSGSRNGRFGLVFQQGMEQLQPLVVCKAWRDVLEVVQNSIEFRLSSIVKLFDLTIHLIGHALLVCLLGRPVR